MGYVIACFGPVAQFDFCSAVVNVLSHKAMKSVSVFNQISPATLEALYYIFFHLDDGTNKVTQVSISLSDYVC